MAHTHAYTYVGGLFNNISNVKCIMTKKDRRKRGEREIESWEKERGDGVFF